MLLSHTLSESQVHNTTQPVGDSSLSDNQSTHVDNSNGEGGDGQGETDEHKDADEDDDHPQLSLRDIKDIMLIVITLLPPGVLMIIIIILRGQIARDLESINEGIGRPKVRED